MWSLHEKDKFLEPLRFSNGKSQADIVKEVLNAIEKGSKIIFVNGKCGTGKSAVALNIARKLGKASIVVPGKNLQAQYKKDYEETKFLKKDNGELLKISVITGRNNHLCNFLKDNQIVLPIEKTETNAKLNDIWEFSKKELEEKKKKDLSADNYDLPCKIEIKEKNWNKLKKYIRENKDIDPTSFNEVRDIKRASIAAVCPYWSPVLPEKYEFKQPSMVNAIKKSYMGLNNTKFIFYQRKPGCKFYEQFNSFIDSDVLVFNSLKYKLESALDRKPLTEVEIIDECDEFLDSFSNQRIVNIDRLQNSLMRVFSPTDEMYEIENHLHELVKQIRRNLRINDAIDSEQIIPLKETGVYDLFKLILKSSEFFMNVDDESYLIEVEETARMFEDFLDESYITASKKDNNLILSIVTTNLSKRFKEMRDKNKILVLMSGTLHSNDVLKNIFGLEEFEIIEAETEKQGEIEIKRTGLEKDCKYANFSCGNHTREDYLKALSKCVEVAPKPILVHINSYNDLPSKEELEKFDIDNLIDRNKIAEIQKQDKTGKLVESFKAGETDILFSTRASRGMDFPGDECKSIIFTKYPNPNVKNAFWRILNKTNPDHYWSFYKDKARRELWQKVYRGLRFKGDHVFVLSPDSRVLEAFEKD